MKQKIIIPHHDECIKPLTYAVIEEEQLGLWLSEDDDDDQFEQDFNEIGNHNNYNEGNINDEETQTEAIELRKEEEEKVELIRALDIFSEESFQEDQ